MGRTGEPHPEDDSAEYPADPRYDDDDILTVPLVEQPAYGRGLWKRPIAFVSAAPPGSDNVPAPSKLDGASIAAQYLAIVFPNGMPPPKPQTHPICDVCKHTITEADERAHLVSFVHQRAMPRTPIPSGIDRTRMGFKYLEKHGFDVDARVGLGAEGQGMLFPIKVKEKRDRLGLGMEKKQLDKEKNEAKVLKTTGLDAGKVRKLHAEQKKKHEKLHRMFYGDDKVEMYLSGLDKVDHGLK